MLTNKGKYGLKAMVYLAGLPAGRSRAGARHRARLHDFQEIPRPDSAELRNAHLVFSKKGKLGGYALAKPASEIRVGHIIRVLNGPLAPFPCASVTAYRPCPDCSNEKLCTVRIVMQQARDALADVLDSRSLAQMRALGEPNEGQLTYQI